MLGRIWNEDYPRTAPLGHSRRSDVQDATRTAEIDVTVAVGCFLCGRSQPAESQASGIENSDQPQSVQTLTSGEGVIGGWLRVRGEFL